MTRGGRAVLARFLALAGLTALLHNPAHAQEPPPDRLDGAALLDDRAPAFAAIKPTDLADGFALMDLLGGIFPDAIRAFATVRDGLGLYAFSSSELSESGVVPDALVLASLGAADADDLTAPHQKGGPRHLYVRHRFVLRLSDGERFLRSAGALLAAHTSSALKALAKRHRAKLVARLRDGAIVAVRQLGDFAVVDYADPWGAGPVNPKLDLSRLLQKMVAPPKQRLSDGLSEGTRALLAEAEASIALVIDPAALAPLLPRGSCRKEWTAGDGALIDGAAVLLRLHPFQWRLELAWSLSGPGRARLAAAAEDDGLLDARAAASDGIAAATLSLGSLQAIRGAPRTAAFSGGPARVYDSLAGCGPIAAVALGARYWPQLLALEVEALAGRLGLAPILPDLRNIAAVARRVPTAKQSWRDLTAWLASVPSSAGETLTRLLAQPGARAEPQRFGDRLATFFDLPPATGFVEAAVERIAGHHDALAVTPESSGLGWYYRMVRRPARFGPQTKLGALYLNVAALLEHRAEAADEGTRAAVRLAASQMGQLGGNLTFDGPLNLLRLELNLSGGQ